jgi:hypothetical protein
MMKRVLVVLACVAMAAGCDNKETKSASAGPSVTERVLGVPKPAENLSSDASIGEISTWMYRAGYHDYFYGRASGRDGFAGPNNDYGGKPLRVKNVQEKDCRLTFDLVFGEAAKPPLETYTCQTSLVLANSRSVNAISLVYRDGGNQSLSFIQFATRLTKGVVCEDSKHRPYHGDFIHLPMSPRIQPIMARWADQCVQQFGNRADADATALTNRYEALEARAQPMPRDCRWAQFMCSRLNGPESNRPRSDGDKQLVQRACEEYNTNCKGKYIDAE